MKDKKTFSFGSSSSSGTASNSSSSSNDNIKFDLNSIDLMKAVSIIRKHRQQNTTTTTSDQDHLLLIRRRLKQYFLYSKLKSLIPLHQQLGMMSNNNNDHEQDGDHHWDGAAEMELEPHECLIERDSNNEDEDNTISAAAEPSRPLPPPILSCKNDDDENDHGWGSWCNVEYEIDEDHEDDEEAKENASSSSSRPAFKPSIKIWRMEDSIQISTVVQKDVSLTSNLFGLLEEEKLDIVFENQYRTETKVAHTIQVRVKPGYDIDALEKKLRTWAGYST